MLCMPLRSSSAAGAEGMSCMLSCSRIGNGEDMAVQRQWVMGVVEEMSSGEVAVVGTVVSGSLKSRSVAGGRSCS